LPLKSWCFWGPDLKAPVSIEGLSFHLSLWNFFYFKDYKKIELPASLKEMFAGLPYFQKINYAESTLSAWGIWILILYRIAFRISAIILISLSSSTFACRIIKKYAMTKAAHSQLVPESRSASFATIVLHQLVSSDYIIRFPK